MYRIRGINPKSFFVISNATQVMGYSDTDVAEYLYSSQPQVDSLVDYLCKDLTKSCRTKPPPVPKVTSLFFSMPSCFAVCPAN